MPVLYARGGAGLVSRVAGFIQVGLDGTTIENGVSNLGWTAILRFGKKKWAWFEGTPLEKKKMAEACRIHLGIKKKDWPLSYPKRPTC
jgi:uncharacterized protein YgiM (DUF1202 family)